MKLAILTFFMVLTQLATAQVKHTIKGHIEGTTDTIIYLANYYGNKLYYNDTTTIDKKGNFTFPGKAFKECGKYAIVTQNQIRFDIILDEENVVMEFTPDCRVENLKFKESKNNIVFYDYVRFINEKMKLRGPIDAVLTDSTKTEEEKAPIREQLKAMNDEVVAYQKDMVKKNPDLLVAKLVKMSMDIELPEAPKDSITDASKKL
jgi:predicted peptidase